MLEKIILINFILGFIVFTTIFLCEIYNAKIEKRRKESSSSFYYILVILSIFIWEMYFLDKIFRKEVLEEIKNTIKYLRRQLGEKKRISPLDRQEFRRRKSKFIRRKHRD